MKQQQDYVQSGTISFVFLVCLKTILQMCSKSLLLHLTILVANFYESIAEAKLGQY